MESLTDISLPSIFGVLLCMKQWLVFRVLFYVRQQDFDNSPRINAEGSPTYTVASFRIGSSCVKINLICIWLKNYTTTLFLPLSFALYKASSAYFIRWSTFVASKGKLETPILMVRLPPGFIFSSPLNFSWSTNWRNLSAKILAFSLLVSLQIIENSSPP